jgi:carbamoyltransferase
VIVLGIWDGHDSGAALVRDGAIVAAVNEERFTRRKLEVCYPLRSARVCLEMAGAQPGDVEIVAFSTSDPAKTFARLVPASKESYYRIRRRKAAPAVLSHLKKRAKYHITEWPPGRLSRAASLALLRRSLQTLGAHRAAARLYDHHDCHAIAAAVGSGFERCGVVTIDGVGDGLCATVSRYAGGVLTRIAQTPARHSPGIFFEHVTNLLNMRELEDEGKVMALADYASPVPDAQNPLRELLSVDGLRFSMPIPGHALLPHLRRLLWYYPNEQFAAMAQRVLENACVELAGNALRALRESKLALAGGVASNVKANRRIRLLPEVEDMYVFPHMGDGGLALGAALLASREAGVPVTLPPDDLAWGPGYGDDAIRAALDGGQVRWERHDDVVVPVADLLARGHIVLWFQGRMEYGPRALGHRSVLARPDRPDLRDRLNLVLKRRVWYQPFCPSMLESDARALLADMKGTPNRHMTSAYLVAPAARHRLAGVINVDGSCRAQIVADEAPGPFAALLREMRARTGAGALLNTSFNIHGEPLVCTPAEALEVFRVSGADALAIGSYLVRRPEGGTPAEGREMESCAGRA